VTKQLAVASIDRGEAVEIMFGLELVNVRNKGVAFGLLSGGEALVLAFTIGTLAALTLYFLAHSEREGLWIAVGLLAGGAVGNLADRLRDGSVVDFLDPPLWPAFNLADVAIVSGVAVLVLFLITPDGDGGTAS